MESMVIKGEYKLLPFLAIPKIKILWHFEIFINTGPYGLEMSKRYSS